MSGTLYVVATPIGNLGDISERALATLRQADLIASEDTRHSQQLLSRYGISTPVTALHDHNERTRIDDILDRLRAGSDVALVSDAGTPLINDPGFLLVRAAHEAGIRVSPVPGPCAAIAALSAAGLPTDRFAFEGFPPRTSSARRRFFEALRDEPRTLVFYESCHRILPCLEDLAATFPPQRRLVIAKELTKVHERLIITEIAEAALHFRDHPDWRKGEFVLVLEGAPRDKASLSAEQRRVLDLLLEECSLKIAVSLAEKITGARKKLLYQTALERQKPET
ncbi:16S rRNA (cytidine1402-2'-O)-methyltransferase [Methylomarinovum tepidoasis]|uniref:Ribosomal RNA small subunit methyltransferase I n=1 Tax=Methylomarinovum tepidoasis TaxID=2840183 RepID=A0AAU9CYG6_9GAMM|nr:16S rRNA (cytidine(1402)-2'-O)-methyltransferase [Methylomarinovum sp. IN45]BCX89069.1 16S rRNA (cytidine1402-2'-O)-methyltransferase [Methylomarinovum sp. IN45]